MSSEQNIPSFNGGYSYTQREMNTLFKFIEYKDDFSILEFGLGNSTMKLFNHFKKFCKNLSYVGYETNLMYCTDFDPTIDIRLYDLCTIDSVILPDRVFDLILIDGPMGEKRSVWYSKLKSCIRKGTILLIDDFNHYKSYGDELDKNFEYELLDHCDECPYTAFTAQSEHSWKIVRIINAKD